MGPLLLAKIGFDGYKNAIHLSIVRTHTWLFVLPDGSQWQVSCERLLLPLQPLGESLQGKGKG
jgi:hypothetical protein